MVYPGGKTDFEARKENGGRYRKPELKDGKGCVYEQGLRTRGERVRI